METNMLRKFILPNGNNLFIHVPILKKFNLYTQHDSRRFESGGFILGYENTQNNSIIIDDISEPGLMDERTGISFSMKDKKHIEKVEEVKRNSSFFLGTWHTHPQDYVTPSHKDWLDWNKSKYIEKPASRYIIFIIVGRKELGLWCADKKSFFKKIYRVQEI